MAATPHHFLAGGGEAAELISSFDWSTTPLGPIEIWTGSLKNTISLILRSQVPMVTLWGTDGIMIYNDAYSDFAEGRHPKLFGSKVREGWPEVADFNDNIMKVGLAGGTLAYRELPLTLYRNDGQPEIVWLNLDYSPLLDERGVPAGVLAIVVEITDKVEAERKLNAERESVKRMFEQAPGFIAVVHGPLHEFAMANEAYLKLVGNRDVIGRTVGEALPEIKQQGFLELLDQVYAEGAPYIGRGVAVDLNNLAGAPSEQRILDFVYQPITDELGKTSGIFIQGHDVTEQKMVEAEIRSESHKLAVLNRTGAAVAAELSVDRIVEIVTDACTELVGGQFGAFFYNVLDDKGESYMLYALSGVPRESFAKFPMPRNTAVFEPTFKGLGVVRSDDILQDPRYGKNDPHWGMPKGHLPVRSYLAVPVISRSGDVIGGLFFGHARPGKFGVKHEELLVGIAGQAATAIDNARLFEAAKREVAERRRAETDLQTLNSTLEQRVTEEVTARSNVEDRLRQVEKMEAVGQLTGGIAHDFNNMLAVVMAGLNLLQRKLAKGELDVSRFIESALEAAQRAATLTQHLLAFSRQQPLSPEPLDANSLVSGMSELLARSLGERVTVHTVLAPQVWPVNADPRQLENAILNLCINARDAMPEGGKVTIETGNSLFDRPPRGELPDLHGEYVVISVIDTGTGMTKELIGRAFEPFFTTKPVGKGTGLGLSQVYGFVTQSGGHVKIFSQEGSGTTIKIYLPRHQTLAQTDAPTSATSKVSLPNRGGEVILVVEDDDRVRALSVEALKDLGYRVIETASPSRALQLLKGREEHVDLLFTDVVMPEMSGRRLADLARETQPHLKVLYTTGYDRNAIRHNGILDPDTHVLPKPFSIDELGLKIRKILNS